MSAATHTPETLATVVCGCCGTTATCRSASTILSIQPSAYVGADVIAATVEFALPKGWTLRDFGTHVWYVCPCHCGADEVTDWSAKTPLPAWA